MTPEILAQELLRASPLIEATAGCPQEPDWHAEGDVLIHTTMVREALETIPRFKDLSLGHQNILRLAAATHDIGKPSTTETVDGKIRAFGHSRRGSEMLQHLWWKEGYLLDLETRKTVLGLIRYHGRPLHGEDRLEAHVAGTSTSVSCRLVAILAEADMIGRTSPLKDKADAFLKIQMFEETAKELGCLDTPYKWPSNHARWTFFKKKADDLSYMAHNDRMFRVHMTCGLPGSGKSELTDKLGLPIVSRDRIREIGDPKTGKPYSPTKRSDQGHVTQIFQETLKEKLRVKQDCIIDGTNLLHSLRANTIDMCGNYGAEVIIHHLDRDRQTIIRQNKKRESAVPESVIERMAESMEFPSVAEAHVVINE